MNWRATGSATSGGLVWASPDSVTRPPACLGGRGDDAFMSVAREMAEHGTFTFVAENPPWGELLESFAKGPG